MNNNDLLNDLHVGSLIKKISDEKKICASKLAKVIFAFEGGNSTKIFKKDDMDTINLIKISDVLGTNLLEVISNQFLLHFPAIGAHQESYAIKFSKKSKQYFIRGNTGSREMLEKIHFGSYLKQIAEKNEWNQKTMGLRLNLCQNAVSRLYANKRINVKKLIQFSIALQRNLIAEIYLSQIWLVPIRYPIDDCEIIVEEHEIRIVNSADPTFLMKYLRELD